ncbi:MAG TPA: Gfo/Idh/MocA family oxidoreductase [bacterium]|nr:Gfo/Idh/MocA family oxidoreductase [bacterium]
MSSVSSPARLRVAIVGCGVIGRRRAAIVRSAATGQVVVVADLDAARAGETARLLGCEATTSWRAAVRRADVDAVVVATTHDWLAPVAAEAARSGKHVLVEKPMARTPEEARTILDAAGPRGGGGPVIKVGFNHRHHPAVWQAHVLVRQGEIGVPCFIRCRYGHGGRPGYAVEWRADREKAGGGELLDQGIHAIDLCRWFLGEFAEGVGFVPTYFWTPPPVPPGTAPVEDNAFGLFRTSEGRVASVHASWTQWKNLFSFEVFGRDGYLIAEGLGRSYGPERLTLGRRRPESGPPDERHFEFPEEDISWAAEWAEFTSAIRERREPLASGYDGWQALRAAHALYESARTGAVVRLNAGDP